MCKSKKSLIYAVILMLRAGSAAAALFSMVGTPPGYLNVKEYGAAGDGVTDDTAAIRAALAACKTVCFPAGVYVLSDGLELPGSVILKGAGSPVMAPFPMLDDDKRFLRPGEAVSLPGTTLLFKGSGGRTVSTERQDTFRSMRYAVKTSPGHPFSISDLAIVLDVRVFDEAGRLTTPANDQSADYDAGLLIDDSPAGSVCNVTVFGYWKKAGLCVVSGGEGGGPHYNSFWDCSFMGNHGVALIGLDDGSGAGLRGTQFYGCNIFASDHHSRGSLWGTTALYIDGSTGPSSTIDGHHFFGGCIRTYLNNAVMLDHASNVSFNGTVFELPPWTSGGVSPELVNAPGRIIGTANTRNVSLISCRSLGLGLQDLSEAMSAGRLFVVNDEMGSVSTYASGTSVRLNADPGNDPFVQLTDNADSVISGWTVRMDISDSNELDVRYDNQSRLRIKTNATAVVRD